LRLAPRPVLATRGALVALLATFAAAPAPALTPDHRLGHVVVPTSETLKLDLDAAKSGYTGSARIALKVTAATDSFQFQALGPVLKKLTLRGARGPVTLRWRAESHGVVTARAARKLLPGAYTLDIDFTNEFGTRADGLYKLQSGGNAYIASQFEAVAARAAFPCWDEPEFKIPWQVTVTVPAEHVAISNTPARRDSVVNGKRVVEFERTAPLPSYLLAVLAGPWETVPIPGMSVPGRLVCPKGTSRLGAFTVEQTPKILAALEKYFGQPYPYKKLDLVAVPEFWAGAMENAGAVTFRDRLLLIDPKEASPAARKLMIAVTAHELAHMWFGDYVTMRWWDDIWLNESFASWMGDKVTQEVAPEFEMPVAELEGTQAAMHRDAQVSTKPIRAKVDGFDNVDEIFDELAYQKGQAVLGMIEQWLGPETFQKGVRQYLADHAWGNAAGSDLWSALSAASGNDVSATVSSFLDQPGVPIINVMIYDNTSVRFEPGRFYNLGAAPPGKSKWITPVTFRYSDGQNTHTRTILVTDQSSTLKLDDVRRIVWLHPNDGERGYYRWNVPNDYRWPLVDRATELLSPRERVGFVNNLSSGLDAGIVPSDETMQMLSRFAADPRPEVEEAVGTALERIRVALVTPELREPFAGWVRKNLGPALDRIGPTPVPTETQVTTLLRPTLLGWVGRWGRDEKVRARARDQAAAYLRDPSSLDPSLVEVTLRLAALDGDAQRFDAYVAAYERAKTPVERNRFLPALGSFGDTALIRRGLDYALSEKVRSTDMYRIWGAAGEDPDQLDFRLAWMMGHYDAIEKRLPPFALPFLVHFGEGCSAERLATVQAFFTGARRPSGMEVEEPKVVDQVTDCLNLRKFEGNTFRNYLTNASAAK
jgi:cytosol alanyl aminopeptidase